jgi:hypothetical protein
MLMCLLCCCCCCCHCCCRVVRAELGKAGSPSSWPDVIPQHAKDLLQSALALKGDELVIR